ncbi:MAG: aminotransferase class IV [Verrucomicrobiota bacterium]
MNDVPHNRLMVIRNGELLPTDAPVIGITDPALIQGHGLFETIQAYQGRPFALSEHLDRLESGCRILGLAAPDRGSVDSMFQRIMEANGLLTATTCRLRITIAAGRESPIEIYEATPSPLHPSTARIITGPFVRNERSLLSGIKTLSYGENAVATQMTKEQGATEAVWSNTKGELCEGTWSNVFVRVSGQWKTPPLDSGCLPGVTRAHLLSLSHDCGFEIEESPIAFNLLSKVEAAFLTSSLREIQPVSHVDGRTLGKTAAQEIKLLQEAYATSVAEAAQSS